MRKIATERRALRALAVLGGGAVLAFGGTGAASAATTMSAADAPTTVTAAPGSTVTVPVTIKNTGSTTAIKAPPGAAGDGVVFTAPPNTTFPAQSTVATQYSADGATYGANAYRLTSCVVSNAGKTLTCQPSSSTGGAATWPAGSYFRFNPTVTVDPTAPADTLLTGSSTVTFTSDVGNQYTTSVGSLHVQTPPVAGGALVSPQGLGLAAGFGVAGAGAVLMVRRRRAGTPN